MMCSIWYDIKTKFVFQVMIVSYGLVFAVVSGASLGRGELSGVKDEESFNCAGLALRTFTWINRDEVEEVLGGFKLSNCSAACLPNSLKFWYWPYDASGTNLATGSTGKTHKDFHIVGGQTDQNGMGPFKVLSKNGHRPIETAQSPKDWYPRTGPQRQNDLANTIVENMITNRINVKEFCYCSKTLP
jgi:hypothetical protein